MLASSGFGSVSVNAAAWAALERHASWSRRGKGLPHLMTSRAHAFLQWQHYPASDAVDQSGRWQFFYHAHDDQRVAGEHGHVHLFRRRPDGRLAHVVALAFDPRGRPLAWFTTNRWVTGGQWLSAPRLIHPLGDVRLGMAGPLAGVAAWLGDMLRLYGSSLTTLLHERDAALARHAEQQGITRARAWNDRRLAVLSRLPVDWPADALRLTAQHTEEETS